MRTTAVYGASDSHVWLYEMFEGNRKNRSPGHNDMCYSGFWGEFPPVSGLSVLKNPNFVEGLRRSESESESERKVKPAFVFHPLRG